MALSNEKTVFISYAQEDSEYSQKLYTDLKNAGLIPWRQRYDKARAELDDRYEKRY